MQGVEVKLPPGLDPKSVRIDTALQRKNFIYVCTVYFVFAFFFFIQKTTKLVFNFNSIIFNFCIVGKRKGSRL